MTAVATLPVSRMQMLRELLCWLSSEQALTSDPARLLAARKILAEYPIELAELRASPKQLDFQRWFFERTGPDGLKKDIFVALGGNRSGKSIVCGRLCFLKHIRDKSKNGEVYWCIAPTFDKSVSGMQKEIWEGLPRRMFGAEDWDPKIGFGMHRKIILPTSDKGRCVIEFKSGDQDATQFETAKLNGIWADEKLPESIYNRTLARIIDKDGWILYSDIPEQWWQHERLCNAPTNAGIVYQHFTMYDNEANLPEGSIDKAAIRMTQDEQRMRIKGLFVVMQGVVYKLFQDCVRYIDEDGEVRQGNLKPAFPIPLDWPRWRIIDYGSSAPTACLWVAMSPNETLYVYREYYQRGLSIQKNAAAILTLSLGPDGKPETYRCTFMDPHAVDQPPAVYGAADTVADQYRKAGIESRGWPFVNVMGEHGMVETVKFWVENLKLLIFEGCIECRREFRVHQYQLDKDGNPKAADAYENKDNHTLDCLKGFLGTRPTFLQGKIEVFG